VTPGLLCRLKGTGVTDKDLAAAGFADSSTNGPWGKSLVHEFVARADDGTVLPKDNLGRLPPWTGNSHTLSILDRFGNILLHHDAYLTMLLDC
jgi:hypothetical protein